MANLGNRGIVPHSSSKAYSDLGTKFRWQHDPVKLEVRQEDKAGMRPRARVYSRNPLETYFRRKVIDYKQKSAGEVFGRLWQAAALEPRIIGRYEEFVDITRSGNAVVRKTEAYEKSRNAVSAVGPIASDEVVAVCCTEEPVRGAAKIEILRRGLDVLAKHFGI